MPASRPSRPAAIPKKGNDVEITAVIPAKGYSGRVSGKNMRDIAGIPLVAWKIEQLSKCMHINRIIVGSDSDEILSIAKSHGAETVFNENEYCDEVNRSVNERIRYMCSLFETDIVVWAHCTNPLLSPDTYDRAVGKYLSFNGEYDSLLSVYSLQGHIWSSEYKPYYDPYGARHPYAGELPPVYIQDGGIFLQPHRQMLENSYFFGRKPYLFAIPESEYLDINTERDLWLARALIGPKGL